MPRRKIYFKDNSCKLKLLFSSSLNAYFEIIEIQNFGIQKPLNALTWNHARPECFESFRNKIGVASLYLYSSVTASGDRSITEKSEREWMSVIKYYVSFSNLIINIQSIFFFVKIQISLERKTGIIQNLI